MVSALGALNGSILSNARVPFAMARDGLFFKPFGLVHATTRGWRDPDDGPEIDWSEASAELVVADVIFNPPESRLLVESKRRGLKTLSGIEMMANQVSLAYRFWTGSDPDSDVIHEALEEYLEV